MAVKKRSEPSFAEFAVRSMVTPAASLSKMLKTDFSVLILTLEGADPYFVPSAEFLDLTPLNSSVASSNESSKVGTGMKISVPAVEPAGNVTVVLKMLKSEPAVAGFEEVGRSSTVKSTL